MWLILLLLLVLLLLSTLLFLTKSKRKEELTPPGPPKLPIIGNLHQLGSLPHQSLSQLSKTYGPVMLLQLGSIPAVVVSSPEAAKEALKTHDLSCCSRPPLVATGKLSYNYLDVGFSPYGEYWRQIRKLCVLNLFSLKSVESFRFIREEETSSLVESLRRSSLSLCPIDVSEHMMCHTASITLRTAFGKKLGESGLNNKQVQEMVQRAKNVLGNFTASDNFPYFGWIVDRLSGLSRKLETRFGELDSFFERMIDEHSKSTALQQEDHEDFVDIMLRVERDQSEIGQQVHFTRDCIKAILMDIFLAGVDTGAITLTWAMTELARSPRAMKKVQSEIRSYIKEGNLVLEKDLHQLHYLKMVIKETLRLHPPVPLLVPRETMSQCNISSYEIHPKTLLQVNVWAIGRDPNYWNEPEYFFPERFNEISTDYKGNHFEFLPFGAGRRGCPGINMGIATVELTLANLLCCFDWKLPDGMKESDIDMEEEYGLTVFKKSALKLVPISYPNQREDEI